MFFDVDLHTGFHRRFFDVGELGGVKQEDWEVFWTTHAKIVELVRDGVVDGVRVDHADGLANPTQYFERLAGVGVEHVWAEKILEGGEELRPWPVEGTTGYEFLNDVMALCVNRRAEDELTEIYESYTGDTRRFEEIAALSKLEIAVNVFEPELRRLLQEAPVEGLAGALSSFHVYRTYVQPHEGIVEDADRAEVARANVSQELRRILLLETPGFEEFVVRFQQQTGPVMAKGVEDTAFYRYFRLTALNEVGGDPARFGLELEAFHEANARRLARFPRHLLTTYTHDTKRSPDVRSRILALTWLAAEWRERLSAWRAELGGLDDPREELLVLQTLVGALPISRERLDAYLEKALREGKVNSNWLTPDEEHERAVQEWAWRAADVVAADPFLVRVRAAGRALACSQLLLKLTAPGVPDLYQGDELEDLSLVDPDNRRPVDWDARHGALAALRDGAAPDASTSKLHVIRTTLRRARGAPRRIRGGVRADRPRRGRVRLRPGREGARRRRDPARRRHRPAERVERAPRRAGASARCPLRTATARRRARGHARAGDREVARERAPPSPSWRRSRRAARGLRRPPGSSASASRSGRSAGRAAARRCPAARRPP